jgi:hypothetical protein
MESKGSSLISSPLLGALIGSLSAFIFFQLSEYLRRKREYNKKHVDTILSLQIELDEHRRIIHDNLQVYSTFDTIIKDAKDSKFNITPDRLKKLVYDEKMIFFLKTPKYGNEIRGYYIFLRKINDECEKFNWMYDTIISNSFSKLDIISYSQGISICYEFLDEVTADLKRAEERVFDLIVKNRIVISREVKRIDKKSFERLNFKYDKMVLKKYEAMVQSVKEELLRNK